MRKDRPPRHEPAAPWPATPRVDAIDDLIARHGTDVVIGVLTEYLTAERIARIDVVLAARLGSVTGVVEDVYDPFNGAAVVRTAEALGLTGLHIVETGLRFQAAKGITRGCHRWMDLVRWPSAPDCIAALRGRGFRVLATAPGATETVDEVDVSKPIAVVFGNEHAGLPPATVAACDGAIALPMFGFTQSYNLSVSAALALSQLAARRRAHVGQIGDLDPAQLAHLRARWFALKVRGAVGLVDRVVVQTRSGVATEPHSSDNG